MQGSLSVSQSELHPMRIKFPYSLVCVLSLTRYIYAQKINERDLLHAHSSVGVSYLHADPQCIYSSWDSFFKDDRNNKVYLCRKEIDFYHNVFNVIRLICEFIYSGTTISILLLFVHYPIHLLPLFIIWIPRLSSR